MATTTHRRTAATALLIIDFFNPFIANVGRGYAAAALRAAVRTARLKARLRATKVPVIYANDNFGNWESEFSSLVERCRALPGAAGEIAALLAPVAGDRSILKPRHSAFFETPLPFLLGTLGVRRLILTGIAADSCITFTAHDAHVREFRVWVPSDCVASPSIPRTRAALAQLRRVLDASVASSTAARR
jgi:nicotinamidase-related amidase